MQNLASIKEKTQRCFPINSQGKADMFWYTEEHSSIRVPILS
jgi:hypothetical protein